MRANDLSTWITAIIWTNADLKLNTKEQIFAKFEYILTIGNTSIFYQENAFENVVYRMSAILFRPQYIDI